jgi:hypothetical protein
MCKRSFLLLNQNEQDPFLLLNSRVHSYVWLCEVKRLCKQMQTEWLNRHMAMHVAVREYSLHILIVICLEIILWPNHYNQVAITNHLLPFRLFSAQKLYYRHKYCHNMIISYHVWPWPVSVRLPKSLLNQPAKDHWLLSRFLPAQSLYCHHKYCQNMTQSQPS